MQKKYRFILQKIINGLNNNRKFGRFWSEFWLKHVEPNSIFRLWFVLPFNGQSERLFCFYSISHIFKPTIGIETGTFYGTSTYLFRGIPTIRKTYSIESNQEFFNISCTRLEKQLLDESLSLINGDSKRELSEILKDLNPQTERVIAYLDAHWEGDIPTIAEIQSLKDWTGNWLAIIDDFQVPGTEGVGYGYDSYNGIDVNYELFESIQEISILVPSSQASRETGARRGTGYLIGGMERDYFTGLVVSELPLKVIRN